MITSKDRIQICVEKYNLTLEEAERIVKADDVLLDINELRLKYDNPDMGKKYPDWLTPEDHLKMCFKTAGESFNQTWGTICTVEELASMLFIQSSIKLNTFKNYKHLKTGLVTISMTIFRDTMRRRAYWMDYSLDDHASNDINSENNITYLDKLESPTVSARNRDFLNEILSIKNNEVKELLIVCGYILAGIDEFESAYEHVVNTSNKIDLAKLQNILEQVQDNDCVEQNKIDKKSTTKHKKRITFTNIVEIFNFEESANIVKNDIKEYLLSTGFLEGVMIGG